MPISESSSSSSSSSSSVVVGFGKNYYHNFGPAQRSSLNHYVQESGEDDIYSVSYSSKPPLTPVPSYQFIHGKQEDGKESSDDKPTSPPPWEQEDDPLIDVQCTIASTHFLTKSGKIYRCGTIHGHISSALTNLVIALPLKCVQLAAGRHFCLARMEGGLAVCAWGAGHFGQLGLGGGFDENGESVSSKTTSPPSYVSRPTVIECLLPHVVGAPVSSVSTGYWHSLAVTKDGNVFAWGCNRNAQCGRKPSSKEPPTVCQPQRVSFDNTAHFTEESSSTRKKIKIHKVAAGRSHSVALDATGQLYSWGANQYGQCGILTRRRVGGVPSPKHVEALAKVRIVDISAGDVHTLGLTGGGRVFGWGGGFEGQLGTGYIYEMNPKPKLVNDLDFVAIEAGQEWRSIQKERPIPSEIGASTRNINLDKTPRITSVTAKGNSSFAISSTGHLYAWGCNDVGHLGLPKPDPQNLTYADPGQVGSKSTSIQRQFHTYSFDSSHNVALPQRLDSLRHLEIKTVGASSTFMWCLGTKREDPNDPVGRTLYEVRQAKAPQGLEILNAGTFGTKSPPSKERPNDGVETNVTVTGWARPDKKTTSEELKARAADKPPTSPRPTEGPATNDAKLTSSSGKKKRLFSPKKVVQAFVRRASGSMRGDRASLPTIDIEGGDDPKGSPKNN